MRNRTLRGGLLWRAFGAEYVLLLDRDAAVMQPTGWGLMFWPPSEMYFLSLDWELKVLGRAVWYYWDSRVLRPQMCNLRSGDVSSVGIHHSVSAESPDVSNNSFGQC